jgi:norsolorinic acid ketoreductase
MTRSSQALTLHSFEVNTVAPLLLFQACLPLLKPGARIVFNSSGAGSITNAKHVTHAPFGAYGSTKAALNCIAAKISAEYSDLICFAVDPGW